MTTLSMIFCHKLWVCPWGWVNFCDIPELRNCASVSQVTFIKKNNDFSLKSITNYMYMCMLEVF